ncbi:MAG: quinone-dependent dihydroorotate dehydrogenase [Pseudomonadota bacterium]|nr:quinone-dependent dihydroorotate dehydrogenase [Pseudomonadota bacterium]|tara:strand:+ start:248 stop:1288 length:1041 start_codon:yes stop_codon:yes gene_type:complete
MFNIFRPLIFKFSPEVAHSLAIKALKLNNISYSKPKDSHILETTFCDKILPSPIGVAAGFDKNAEVYNPLFNLGFGFVEVGTITPKAQFGNPKPRVFRLEEDEALINRLGFNNSGSDEISKRIKENIKKGFLGINIGPNKDSTNRISDYLICFRKFHNLADYITINISSPNTENLRDFHNRNELNSLIDKLKKEKKELNSDVPLAIKVSPDLNDDQINEVSKIILDQEIKIIIISNTTDKNREDLKNINKLEKGGLSGKPIEKISNEIISKFYKILKNKTKIIGVGGVSNGNDAFEKIARGATLVQLYTGMVYRGPSIARKISNELIILLKNKGFKNVSEAIGTKN